MSELNKKIMSIVEQLEEKDKIDLFLKLKRIVYNSPDIVICPTCGSKNFYRYKNGQYRCQRCSTRYEKDGSEINE